MKITHFKRSVTTIIVDADPKVTKITILNCTDTEGSTHKVLYKPGCTVIIF